MELSLLERQRRAMTGDDSPMACAHRLRAARFVAGVQPEDIAGQRGRLVPPDLAHIRAAESGDVLPDAALQGYYWRKLKLPADFFDSGRIERIPVDIEFRLFAGLNRPRAGK